MSKLTKKSKKILATAFALSAVSAVGAGFALQSINANAAAAITVTEIRDWNLEADNDITIITDMYSNPQWDTINALELAYENPAFHPHLTINGYRSTVDGAYYFEEYNYAPLHLWTYMFGGPVLGYPSATVGYIGYLYDVLGTYLGQMGFVDSFPADTVVVCDGPVGNFLGETEAGAPYTAQWVNRTWQKVNSITLSSKPTKTTYQIGESVDMSGAKIKIDYASIEDREFAYADSITNCDVIGFDTTTPGDKTAYVNYHGQVFAFNYTVEASANDRFVKGVSYSADKDNYYFSLALEGEVPNGTYAELVNALSLVNGNTETKLSTLSGASVTVDNGVAVVAVPKSSGFVPAGGMSVKGVDVAFATDLTLKGFQVALPASEASLAWTLNYAVVDGVQSLAISSNVAVVGNGYAADINSLKNYITAGDKKLSEIDGANITVNGNVITVSVPKSSYDLNGKTIALAENVYMPSLNILQAFYCPILNDQMSSPILEAGTWGGTTRSVFFSFNVYDYDNYADNAFDYGWGYSLFNYAIEMNGETNLYHWEDGTESIVNFMGFGGAGLSRPYTTYNLLGWSYKTDGNGNMLGGEANWFNFPAGTILKVKKGTLEFNGAKIYIDNDYYYELVGDTFVPISYELVSAPSKTTYLVGESFDLSGMKAKITYTDGNSKTVDIAPGMYTNVSGFDNTLAGNKKATVNYRGMNFTVDYTIEKQAGEIAATGMSYSTTKDNHVFTVALNDTYEAGALDAFNGIKIACGNVVKAVSELNGATVVCDGAAPYANLVITVPKASLTLDGEFSVVLENDVVITTATEETTFKAFAESYAVSALKVAGAAVANNVITLTVDGNVNTAVYADFTALLNAVKLGDKTLAEVGATVSYASANTIAISVPASVDMKDTKIVLDTTVMLPSLDTVSEFKYIISDGKVYNEASIIAVSTWGGSQSSLFIHFNMGTDVYNREAWGNWEFSNTSFNANVSANGQKSPFIFDEYEGAASNFAVSTYGALVHNIVENPEDGLVIIAFMYDTKGSGEKHIPNGTILTIGRNFNATKEGYILDRDYTYQWVKADNGVGNWVEVSSVEMISAPTTEFYALNENVSLAGAQIKVTYADGTSNVTTLEATISNVSVSGFDSTEVGSKTATINFYGEKFNFNYEVKDITGYAIATQPAKTTYKVGEELNLNGLAVDILFGESSRRVEFGSRELPEGFTVEGFTATEPTDSLTLTIKYNDAVVGTITLVIEAPIVESIEVTAPTKVDYYVGDALDLTGGSLVPYFDIGKYGDAVDLTAEGVEISGYDSSIVGVQTITVSYNGQVDTFEVNVQAIVVTFAQAVAPTEAVYNKTQATLEIVGGGFTAYYNNGAEEVIEFLDERVTLSFDRNTMDETVEITAKFGDYTCKFTATVVVEIVEEPTTDNSTSMFGCSASVSAAMSLTVLLGGVAVAFLGKRKDEE